MKTLEQIKNDYAVSEGSIDWKDFTFWFDDVDMEKHMDNICILAQKECLKLASDNILIRPYLDGSIDYSEVNEQITNENNIIK